MNKTLIKIVIADDNRFFCEALRDSLNSHKEFKVIHFSTHIKELINFCDMNTFDLLILDVNFNGVSSLDFIDEIRKNKTQFKIISLTTLNNNFMKRKALSGGVNCFVGKDTDFSLFKNVILDCLKDKKPEYTSETKKININNLVFTERKLEILQALYQHSEKKEKDLSAILNISTAALKTHKRELFEITNTSNTNELIKFGIQNGIIIS